MNKILTGQTAVVTGGSRGIGRGICLKLAGLGADVFVNYNSSPEQAQITAAGCVELGVKAEAMQFNVAESEAVDLALKDIHGKTGRIDILVNNAGISKNGLFVRTKNEEWESILAVNLTGAFNCSRAAAKYMMKARKGRIINISSVTAEMGNAGQVPYISSKAGIIGMTRALAKELAPRFITVNAVTPGFISTDMTGDITGEKKEEYMSSIPLGRFGTPEDVAGLVAFLAGPDSSYITGQVIGINGGMYM